MTASVDTAQYASELWQRVHQQTPLIQCITNTVVQNFTANVVIATGAAPAMVDVAQEAADFAKIASGLLVNLGTVSPHQVQAIPLACAAARDAGTPWVLDPVAAGAVLPFRTGVARDSLRFGPAAIRGNASEVMALAGGAGGRGVDATDSVEDAAVAARTLAADNHTVVAVSGATDYVTDGTRSYNCANGSPLLTQVTGGGCALGAVIAAFLAAGSDPVLDVAVAHSCYGIAAERAARGAGGPGSFGVAFLDALATLTAADVRADARIRQATNA